MTINERLISAKEKAELSVTDMGLWFGVHRRTMESWLHGVTPHEYRHSQIIAKLDLLEQAIKMRTAFPVPMAITQYQRKDYLQRVLNAVSGRVSKTRSSK